MNITIWNDSIIVFWLSVRDQINNSLVEQNTYVYLHLDVRHSLIQLVQKKKTMPNGIFKSVSNYSV